MSNGSEPTNQDILEAINSYATNTDRQLERIEGRLDGVESRLTRVESQMVTKEYLDDKLADLKGDILTILRKEDRRVTALVEIMQKKNLLNAEEVKYLETMQPLIPTSRI